MVCAVVGFPSDDVARAVRVILGLKSLQGVPEHQHRDPELTLVLVADGVDDVILVQVHVGDPVVAPDQDQEEVHRELEAIGVDAGNGQDLHCMCIYLDARTQSLIHYLASNDKIIRRTNLPEMLRRSGWVWLNLGGCVLS